MNVVVAPVASVTTKYLAERDGDPEREGAKARPLFNERDDCLSRTTANHHLNSGKPISSPQKNPDPKDLIHLAISPDNAHAYERLGDTVDERFASFRTSARELMEHFAREMNVTDVKWVAGIHLNTKLPHVHILIHRDAVDRATGMPKRIDELPRELYTHNRYVERAAPQGQAPLSPPYISSAHMENPHESPERAADASKQVSITGIIYESETLKLYQPYQGIYLTLDHKSTFSDDRKPLLRTVEIDPQKIFDPAGVIKGSDHQQSQRDDERLQDAIKNAPMKEWQAIKTECLRTLGYEAAAHWEDEEHDPHNQNRELIVFDVDRVKPASLTTIATLQKGAGTSPASPAHLAANGEGRPANGEKGVSEGRADGKIKVTQYGKLAEYFAESLARHAYPVRGIAFSIDNPEEFTRRELVDARERRPTKTERVIGAWIQAEARNNGRESDGEQFMRLRLRAEAGRLDHEALSRGEARPRGYIPVDNLRELVIENGVRVLTREGTLAPRYHDAGELEGPKFAPRVEDIQPAHGGGIYGLVSSDSRRIIAREIVTISPDPAREPVLVEPLSEHQSKETKARSNRFGAPHGKSNKSEGERSRLIHVTASEPCQVCGKPDNCAITEDGALAYCRRTESERQGRDGGYWHDLRNLPDWQPRDHVASKHDVAQYEVTSVEHRDTVYRAMLAKMRLLNIDMDDLRARGLSPEAIERHGIVSVSNKEYANKIAAELHGEGHDLRGVPGFWREPAESGNREEGSWQLNLNRWYRGFMIPVKDPEGRVQSLQIRRREPGKFIDPVTGKESTEAKYVWLSSKTSDRSPRPEGTPAVAAIHYVNVERLRETGQGIITEGSLKGIIAAEYTDRGVICVPGVGVFPPDFGHQLREHFPELRKVSIGYDADYTHNKNVEKQLGRLHSSMREAKLEIETLKWDEERAGKGIDDYLTNKLGKDYFNLPSDRQIERREGVLKDIGYTLWKPSVQESYPEVPKPSLRFLQPGEQDKETGRCATPDELTVARWLRYEAHETAKEKPSPTLSSLQMEVSEIDRTTRKKKLPQTPAVMRPEELQAALDKGILLTQEELKGAQRHVEGVLRGDELSTRLFARHAQHEYVQALEGGEMRRYPARDASTGHTREMSITDVDNRSLARSNRAAAGADAAIEAEEPNKRGELRAEIKEQALAADHADHRETFETIKGAHAARLAELEDRVLKTHLEHDRIAPAVHRLERVYRTRDEEMPMPIIAQATLDRLHEQAIKRGDVETIRELDGIRHENARADDEAPHTTESAGRLAAQERLARCDHAVARRRQADFARERTDYKWDVEGEDRKYSLNDVEREQRRNEREIEYHERRSSFFGPGGFARSVVRGQIAGFNPLNALHPSALNPLNAVLHHPAVKVFRVGYQLYQWNEGRVESKNATQAALARLEGLSEIRESVTNQIGERTQALAAEVAGHTELSAALTGMHEAESLRRAAAGEAPIKPEYKDWELRRLEANAAQLRSGEMLTEYEGIVKDRMELNLARVREDFAAGRTPEMIVRDLAEGRIKDRVAQLEPPGRQVHTLAKRGVEVPENRMLASEAIEKLTGEPAIWKKVGAEAVARLREGGEPLTPETLERKLGGSLAAVPWRASIWRKPESSPQTLDLNDSGSHRTPNSFVSKTPKESNKRPRPRMSSRCDGSTRCAECSASPRLFFPRCK